MVKVTDLLGGETAYTYDTEGRLLTKLEPDGRLSTITYDNVGYVVAFSDSQGVRKSFDYNYDATKKHYYAMVRYPSGKVKEVWFNGSGKKIRTDINGHTVSRLEIDGREERTYDGQGNVTTRWYDKRHNLSRIDYPDGSMVSYAYDLRFSEMVRQVDERGVVTEYEYDDQGNRTRMIEAKGTPSERQTEYSYDAKGNLITTKRLANAKSAEALTTMAYDEAGNLVTTTDPMGHSQRFTHDAMGNVLTRTDGNGKVWSYTYDAKGQRLTSQDPVGNVTREVHDGQGRLVRTIDAAGAETRYEYDSDDHLVKQIDALGGETGFTYDLDGNLLSQSDPLGHGAKQEYNDDGQLAKRVDGSNNVTSMEYAGIDGSGCSSCSGAAGTDQPVRIVYPTFTREISYDLRGRKVEERDIVSSDETLVTGYSYDPAGNLLSKTDPQGRVTSHQYDELNRLVITTDPMAGETRFSYDNRDNLLALTDAEGHTTAFTYDTNNRLLTETRPNGQATGYEYDGNGQLTMKSDSLGQRTEYLYDPAGRVITTRYFKTGESTPVKSVTFTYNPTGTLASWSDGLASASYRYDALNRKLEESVNYGTFTLSHGYDYYANGLKQTFHSPDGSDQGYIYDANNQLLRVAIPGQGDMTYNGYNWTKPTGITYPGGASRQLGYDPLQRLKTITTQDPGHNLQQEYHYRFDQSGNITGKETEHGDYAYRYDLLSRLTETTRPEGEPEAFSYDLAGNRLTAAEVAGFYLYNENNELLGVDATTFEYDENGNTVSKAENGTETRYRYDIDNRLVAVTDGQGATTASYGYDPFGRRLWKEVGTTRTYFHYADEGMVAEADANGTVTKSYGYAPNSTWTTAPLFMKVGSEYYFYQNDHLGTPQQLIAMNGAVVWQGRYDAFGKANVGVGVVENNLRFPGQYYDAETGLHYNWNRYYDPTLGRYLMPDPIGLKGGMNFFAYVRGNPVNATDPHGLAECMWAGFSGDFVPGFGAQAVAQKGRCKNKCDQWEWKTRNCLCSCVGISGGWSVGGGGGTDSSSDEGWEVGVGPGSVSGSDSGVSGVSYSGGGVGLKYGVKYCWCHCDVF